MDRLRPGGAWQKEDPDVTFPLAGANRTSSMHFTSIDDFIGQSTRAIAVSMTSSAEIIVRPRMKTQSYFDDRADYLVTSRACINKSLILFLGFNPVIDPAAIRPCSYT